MEIKILVPENRESDLDNFIKTCEDNGFELQNRGGGTMPNFSGYYATLKGSRWKEIPNPTAQLQADKEELLEALEKISKVTNEGYITDDTDFQVWESELKQVHSEIESLIQKHKQ